MLSPHIQPGTSLPKPAHCAVAAWAGITSSHLIPLAHSSHLSKRSNKSFFVFVASLAQQGKSISGIVFARLPVPGIAGAAVVLLRVMLLCSMPWDRTSLQELLSCLKEQVCLSASEQRALTLASTSTSSLNHAEAAAPCRQPRRAGVACESLCLGSCLCPWIIHIPACDGLHSCSWQD